MESSEEVTFETSIGRVRVHPEGRNWVAVATPYDVWPCAYLALARCDGRWELDDDPLPFTSAAMIAEKISLAPAVVNELSKLGREWALAHPEAFELAGDNDYVDQIERALDPFPGLIEDLKVAQQQLSEVLEDDEFLLQAPEELRSRVSDAAKMLHVMKLQTEAAAEALSDAAGEESQGQGQSR